MKRSDVKSLKYLSTWIYIHISYWTYRRLHIQHSDSFFMYGVDLPHWASLSQDDPRKHECRGKMNQGEVRQWTRSSAVWWSCNTTKSPIWTWTVVPNAFVSNVKVSWKLFYGHTKRQSWQHPLAVILHIIWLHADCLLRRGDLSPERWPLISSRRTCRQTWTCLEA